MTQGLNISTGVPLPIEAQTSIVGIVVPLVVVIVILVVILAVVIGAFIARNKRYQVPIQEHAM